MRFALLALFLASCATVPEQPDAQVAFVCQDGTLVALLKVGEHGYISPVGHCLGDLQIIGPRPRGRST